MAEEFYYLFATRGMSVYNFREINASLSEKGANFRFGPALCPHGQPFLVSHTKHDTAMPGFYTSDREKARKFDGTTITLDEAIRRVEAEIKAGRSIPHQCSDLV